MSFLLSDVEHRGTERVTAALYKMSDPHSRHEWIVRIFDEYRYLIQAPSQFWLDYVLSKHTLRLENRDIPIQEWDPSYAQGMRMIPIWIRVRGFPMMLWQTKEFEALLEDFGAILLDQDPATVNYWIMFKDASGHVSRYDILFKIENERPGSYFNPKRPRTEGGGSWQPKSKGPGPKPPPGPRHSSSRSDPSAPSSSETSQAPPSTHDLSGLSAPLISPPILVQPPVVLVNQPTSSSEINPTSPVISELLVQTSDQPSGPAVPVKIPTPLSTHPVILTPSEPEVLMVPAQGQSSFPLNPQQDLNSTSTLDQMLIDGDTASPDEPGDFSEDESFDEVLQEIEVQRAVTGSSPHVLVTTISALGTNTIRKSARLLKIQGLNTTVMSMAMKRAREKHLEEQPTKGNPLLDAFPFTRLTNAEIASLFQVYKITLGHSESQRDFIIGNMRSVPRPSFEDILRQAFDLTREVDTSVMLGTDLGLSCVV